MSDDFSFNGANNRHDRNTDQALAELELANGSVKVINRADEKRLSDLEALAKQSDFLDVIDFANVGSFQPGNWSSFYTIGKAILQQNNFHLLLSETGKFASHDIFQSRQAQAIAGVSCPADFLPLQHIKDPEEFERLETLIFKFEPEPARKFWLGLLRSNGNTKTQLEQHAINLLQIESNRLSQEAETKIETVPTLVNPGNGYKGLKPIKWLPAAEWFDPAVRQLKLSDILTIMPKAEQEMLALLIGRGLVGASGSRLLDGNVIQHKSRIIGVIVGDAGIGKSTLFDALFAGLSVTGYTYSTFQSLDSRFGLGKTISADIIYKDDSDNEQIVALMQSANAKSIATGGKLEVEEKNQPSRIVRAKGVIIMHSNDFNPLWTYVSDLGMVDRVKFLGCYTKAELSTLKGENVSAMSPDLKTYEHLQYLSTSLNVSVESIMLWLARLSADRFLDTIENDMQEAIKELDESLKLRLDQSSLPSLLLFFAWSYAVKQVLINKDVEAEDIAKFYDISQDSELMFAAIKPAVAIASGFIRSNPDVAKPSLEVMPEAKRLIELLRQEWLALDQPELHPYIGFKSIQPRSLRLALASYEQATALGTPAYRRIEQFFYDLLLSKGLQPKTKTAKVTALWLDKVLGHRHQLVSSAKALTQQMFSEFMEEMAATQDSSLSNPIQVLRDALS